MTTRVLMITDKSGSMAPLQGDVRAGFNNFLDELAKDTEHDYLISSVVFDTVVTPLCDWKPLTEVPRLDHINYKPDGFTALLDAVHKSVTRLEDVQLADGDRVLVVIQTDGQENASRDTIWGQVRDLIQRLEATGRWAFQFIGQGPDSWNMGREMGSKYNVQSREGAVSTRTTYSTMPEVVRLYAGGQSAGAVTDFLEEAHRKTGTLAEESSGD